MKGREKAIDLASIPKIIRGSAIILIAGGIIYFFSRSNSSFLFPHPEAPAAVQQVYQTEESGLEETIIPTYTSIPPKATPPPTATPEPTLTPTEALEAKLAQVSINGKKADPNNLSWYGRGNTQTTVCFQYNGVPVTYTAQIMDGITISEGVKFTQDGNNNCFDLDFSKTPDKHPFALNNKGGVIITVDGNLLSHLKYSPIAQPSQPGESNGDEGHGGGGSRSEPPPPPPPEIPDQ